MAIDAEARTTRRGMLAAALGGVGALLASRLVHPAAAEAANGDSAILGQHNQSTLETVFENTIGGPSLHAVSVGAIGMQAESQTWTGLLAQSDSGHAIDAHSNDGIGVNASSYTAASVRAESISSVGVDAISGGGPAVRATNSVHVASTFSSLSNNSGVVGLAGLTGTPGAVNGIALSTDETGVYGYSNISANATGVWGDTWQGTGVLGTGDWGVAGYGGSIGVYAAAASPTGYALFTQGKIRFNGRAGRTYITSGHVYKDVAISGMTTGSYVIASLVTHRTGYTVESVVSYTGKFRLYLNKAAASTIYFSYLVIG